MIDMGKPEDWRALIIALVSIVFFIGSLFGAAAVAIIQVLL